MTHEADVIGDRAHFAQLDNASRLARGRTTSAMASVLTMTAGRNHSWHQQGDGDGDGDGGEDDGDRVAGVPREFFSLTRITA